MSARPPRRLKFGIDARAAIVAGVDVVADAVTSTLGPSGRLVMLDSYFGTPELEVSYIDRRMNAPVLTNDGFTISREIVLADGFRNQGVLLARDIGRQVKEGVGDGTTSAILLARAMLHEGLRALAAGTDALALWRGIRHAVAAVGALLDEAARPLDDADLRIRLATAVAGHDVAVGEAVGRAADLAGGGFVAFEPGLDLGVSVERSTDYAIDRGYVTPHLLNEPMSDRAVLERPLVLICAQKLERSQELSPLLAQAAAEGRPLLIVAEEFSADVLAMLTVNYKQRRITAVPVASPAYGNARRELLEDLAVLTGGDVLGGDEPGSVAGAGLAQLGQAERIVVNRSHTTVSGGQGDALRVALRSAALGATAEEADNAHDRDELLARQARLSGRGVVTIKVGAATEVERRERLRAAQDAYRAIAVADEGVLAGGGAALLRASAELDLDDLPEDERRGAEVVARALRVPAAVLAANAGLDPATVIDRILQSRPEQTVDARTGELVDARASGIVDLVTVVRSGMETAAFVAHRVLGTEALVVQPLYGQRLRETAREGGPANLSMPRR